MEQYFEMEIYQCKMQQHWHYLDKYHFVKNVTTLYCAENPLVKRHFYCCNRHKRPNEKITKELNLTTIFSRARQERLEIDQHCSDRIQHNIQDLERKKAKLGARKVRKYRTNRKSNKDFSWELNDAKSAKIAKITNVTQFKTEEAKKGPEISANIAKVTRIFLDG